MSIRSEIERIKVAKSSLTDAIEEQGVEVPEGALLNNYAEYVRAISGSGGLIHVISDSPFLLNEADDGLYYLYPDICIKTNSEDEGITYESYSYLVIRSVTEQEIKTIYYNIEGVYDSEQTIRLGNIILTDPIVCNLDFFGTIEDLSSKLIVFDDIDLSQLDEHYFDKYQDSLVYIKTLVSGNNQQDIFSVFQWNDVNQYWESINSWITTPTVGSSTTEYTTLDQTKYVLHYDNGWFLGTYNNRFSTIRFLSPNNSISTASGDALTSSPNVSQVKDYVTEVISGDLNINNLSLGSNSYAYNSSIAVSSDEFGANAIGNGSFAQGVGKASGLFSHAEGDSHTNYTTGNYLIFQFGYDISTGKKTSVYISDVYGTGILDLALPGSNIYKYSNGESVKVGVIKETPTLSNQIMKLVPVEPFPDDLAIGDLLCIAGYKNWALGQASHTENSADAAYGESSHAEGIGTISVGQAQHVQGTYNIAEENLRPYEKGIYAHIVGNGTVLQRSNAHTLKWTGEAWFAKDVFVGSTSGTNQDSGSKKLATETYVNNSSQAIPISEIVELFN